MQRTTVLSGSQPLSASAAEPPDEAPVRRVVIAVASRPPAIVIEVHDEEDLDEGSERLRVELQALVYSSELI